MKCKYLVWSLETFLVLIYFESSTDVGFFKIAKMIQSIVNFLGFTKTKHKTKNQILPFLFDVAMKRPLTFL